MDLAFTFPIAILMARTKSYEKLTYHVPTGALISIPIISSIVLQLITHFGFQV